MKRVILLLALSFCMVGFSGDAEAPKQERVQCWAMTKSGNRCKRRAAIGKRYCHQHASSVTPKVEQKRCRSMTEDGKQCESTPVEGKNYCEKHMEN